MARQKDQTMRFTNEELALMKSLFAENEDLFFIIRKHMLQFKLTKTELGTMKKFVNPSVYQLLRKIFLPELDGDAPLFQLTDLINGLNIDMKSGKSTEDMMLQIEAKEIEENFIDQQLKEIVGEKVENRVSLLGLSNLSMPDKRQVYVNVLARNFLLSYVDSNLQQVKFLAGNKEETVEETIARLQKNSAK